MELGEVIVVGKKESLACRMNDIASAFNLYRLIP